MRFLRKSIVFSRKNQNFITHFYNIKNVSVREGPLSSLYIFTFLFNKNLVCETRKSFSKNLNFLKITRTFSNFNANFCKITSNFGALQLVTFYRHGYRDRSKNTNEPKDNWLNNIFYIIYFTKKTPFAKTMKCSNKV